jgi:glycosyltransferase involved in cell wall biosynthesis
MVFCPNPSELRNWVEMHCNDSRESLHVFELHDPVKYTFPLLRVQLALNGLAWWRFTARAIKEARTKTGLSPDLVFFLWLDNCVGRYQNHHVNDMIFPYNWSGLYFHPYHLRVPQLPSKQRGGIHDYDESLRSNRCQSVAILDEGIAQRLQEKLADKPVIVFPDIADTSHPDRTYSVRSEVIAKANGRKIIALIGGLAKRKGMLTLLRTARQSPSEEWFFLFAGTLAEDSFSLNELRFVHEAASDPSQNCYFHFSYIPEEAQFNALVEASDILFASYEDFPHSSNILTKAALFEKPVIVSKGYCMEERVRAFGMGECIDYDDVAQCREAIGRLLATKSPKVDFAGYRSLHSEERFQMALRAVCADVM